MIEYICQVESSDHLEVLSGENMVVNQDLVGICTAVDGNYSTVYLNKAQLENLIYDLTVSLGGME